MRGLTASSGGTGGDRRATRSGTGTGTGHKGNGGGDCGGTSADDGSAPGRPRRNRGFRAGMAASGT
ncbi:hypothetical protein EF908_05305, partial [Streptomyces sp. WAC04770]